MPTKTFDCVRMKREIQERFNEQTCGMSPSERNAYIKRRADEFRRTLEQSPGKGNFKALFEALELEQEKRGNL